jgi:3-isopropylmalate/(R)-2-methylmalate dehydratase small subunit
MEPFTTLRSRVIPLQRANIDTDQIIPARYLKAIGKEGLADGLFADWRCDATGLSDPDFPLNREICRGAGILLAEENFGCGSSREHAVWALVGWGIRAVIAPSFADIFRNNAYKNGLLPVVLEAGNVSLLFDTVEMDPASEVEIDLRQQSVSMPDGRLETFQIDRFARFTLLNGMDQLEYLFSKKDQIEAFEVQRGI